MEIKLTHGGGNLILQRTKELGIDILAKRPKVYKFDLLKLLLK